MTLRWLRAAWQCDGCGKDFVVAIDQGRAIPQGWDLMEVARDAIRGGEAVTQTGKHTSHTSGILGSCSVQADMNLCPDCTRVADDIGDDNYSPTKTEIIQALHESSSQAGSSGNSAGSPA
jgi:hypothetical protein